MKKRTLLLSSVTAAFFCFASLSIGQSSLAAIADADDVFYLTGETTAESGSESDLYGINWSTVANTFSVTDGEGHRDIKFKKGDQFKFVKNNGWGGALGAGALKGSARGYFDGSDNVYCNVGGTYRVTIANNSLFIDLIDCSSVDVYIQVHSYANTYVYVFDETTNAGSTLMPLGGWPGTEAANCTQHTNFDSSLGAVAKFTIPYLTLANTKIIVSDGVGKDSGGAQSGNQSLVGGYYYWDDGLVGDASYGAQAKVVYDIEKAINASTGGSVCNVSKSIAADLISEYDALDLKTRVDSSTMYTWAETVGGEKADHKYSAIVGQLRTIANGSGDESRISSPIHEDSNQPIVVTAVIASMIIISGAIVIYFARKNKREW